VASIIIHLAVGEVYCKNYTIKNKDEFMQGVADPDLFTLNGKERKIITHYGDFIKERTTIKEVFEKKVNLKKYLKDNNLDNDYNKGYFLHLLTDYLFFTRFLYKPEFETKDLDNQILKILYVDYKKVNLDMLERYGAIDIYTEFGKNFVEGEPEIFTKKELFNFIEKCGELDIVEIAEKLKTSEYNQKDIKFKI